MTWSYLPHTAEDRAEMLAAIGRHEREKRLKRLDPSELMAVKEILWQKTTAPTPPASAPRAPGG